MRTFRYEFMSHCRILLGLLLITAVSSLQAVPLNLNSSFPDFTVNFSDITFDSGTGLLTISGAPASYTETPGGDQHPVTAPGAAFNLQATLTGACPGPSCITGTSNFTIDGVVRDVNNFPAIIYDGSTNPNGLLSGDLSDFGWSATGATTGIIGTIEFTFDNASGIIAEGSLTQGGGGPYYSGGMILTITNDTMTPLDFDFETGLFDNDWTYTGYGDVFVPIPAAVWLFGSGLVGLAGVAGRRRRTV